MDRYSEIRAKKILSVLTAYRPNTDFSVIAEECRVSPLFVENIFKNDPIITKSDYQHLLRIRKIISMHFMYPKMSEEAFAALVNEPVDYIRQVLDQFEAGTLEFFRKKKEIRTSRRRADKALTAWYNRVNHVVETYLESLENGRKKSDIRYVAIQSGESIDFCMRVINEFHNGTITEFAKNEQKPRTNGCISSLN